MNALGVLARLAELVAEDPSHFAALRTRATSAFRERFVRNGRCLDVVDGPVGDDSSLRPNQLLAISLPMGPLVEPGVVLTCSPLLASLGLRSRDPGAAEYRGRHRGDPAQRDGAYHQGTVWPWLIGPYVEAALKCRLPVVGLLDALDAHIGDWVLGSVSETADGDPPHDAAGCPFQAWSVAELLRARRLAAS